MICEIINPSDPYTLVTDDFEKAAVAIAVIGNGKLGLSGYGPLHSPVLFGWDEWFEKRGITDLGAYLDANLESLAAILDTVLIGSAEDREVCDLVLAAIPEEARPAFLEARHDKMRTSMNDIGAAAKAWAERLRKKARANATTEARP
jgi:hypothetical protein